MDTLIENGELFTTLGEALKFEEFITVGDNAPGPLMQQLASARETIEADIGKMIVARQRRQGGEGVTTTHRHNLQLAVSEYGGLLRHITQLPDGYDITDPKRYGAALGIGLSVTGIERTLNRTVDDFNKRDRGIRTIV